MKNVNDLRFERAEVKKKVNALKLINEVRGLTADEDTRYNDLLTQISALDGDIKEALAEEERRKKLATDGVFDPPGAYMNPDSETRTTRPGEGRTYRPGEKVEVPDFHLGRVVRAMARPEFMADLNKEERATVQSGVGSAGGILVPSDLSPAIIQPLREKSNILANMVVHEMPHNNLQLVGIDSDVDAIDAHPETADMDESEITFAGIDMKGVKIGTWIPISAENLFASNAADLIQDSLLATAARKLEYYAIHGNGGLITGLEHTAGIFSSLAVAALTYGELNTEIHDLIGANVPQPYQCFYANDVSSWLDGVQDATTKAYVGPTQLPKTWNEMTKFDNGVIADGYLVFGNFRKYGVVGMGSSWSIEVDPYTEFKSGNVLYRIMGFYNVAYTQPAAFQVMEGITSVTDLA